MRRLARSGNRYLAENFNLSNREALLDEVYARIG